MTQKECETKIAEHMEAIVEILHEYSPRCKYLSMAYIAQCGSESISFNNAHFNDITDAKKPIDHRKVLRKTTTTTYTPGTNVTVHKDSTTGTYTIMTGGKIAYECLGEDEVFGVLNELFGTERKENQ